LNVKSYNFDFCNRKISKNPFHPIAFSKCINSLKSTFVYYSFFAFNIKKSWKYLLLKTPGIPEEWNFIPQNPEEQKNTFLIFLIPQGMKFGEKLQTLIQLLWNTSRNLSNKHQNRKTTSLTSSLKFGQYIYMGLYSNSQFNIKVSGGRGTDYIKWQFTEISVIEHTKEFVGWNPFEPTFFTFSSWLFKISIKIKNLSYSDLT
jgi:hypothetical protein